MMLDGEAFGAEIVGMVKDYVERCVTPLQVRIADLEERLLAALKRPSSEEIAEMVTRAVAALPPAKDGADADPEVIRDMVDVAVAALPPPAAGKDADLEIVRVMIEDAVAALPPARDGKDADPQTTANLVAKLVTEAVAALPLPKDGRNVDPEEVRSILRDEVERAVEALPKAKDGIGLAGAMINRAGGLVVTLTDGTQRDLGEVVGKDVDMAAVSRAITEAVAALPKPRDGVDGLGFDDLAFSHDGERGFVLRFSRGDFVKEFPFTIPVVLDRGVFKAEQGYEAGDAVTWAGSIWIAKRATSAKPGEPDGDWRLAVKAGRNGKDAERPI